MTETEIQSLRERIAALKLEHDDLDVVISRMSESQLYNDDQMHRLKKKKLFLKDQVAMLQRRLQSDTQQPFAMS